MIDSRSAVLAVAAASPEDERRLLAGEGGTATHELKVAEKPVGALRVRARSSDGVDAVTLRMVTTLIALEVERTLAPERADQKVASGFIGDLINGVTKEAADVTARAEELGIEVERGCAFVLARATPRKAVGDDWRARLLLVVERVARSLHPRVVTAQVERPGSQAGEVYVLLPELRAGVDRQGRATRSAKSSRRRSASSTSPSVTAASPASRPISSAPARKRCSPSTSPRPTAPAT